MHYADLEATTMWQELAQVGTGLTLRNQGTNHVRISKGDDAPDGEGYGILLRPDEAYRIAADQSIWYRSVLGTSIIGVTDIE